MTAKTQQFYYNLLFLGYIFRLLRVIIRPSNEPTQDYPIPGNYEGHLESKERFDIKKYLLIIGKKRIRRFYHTPSPTSPHSHLGH